jgi:hypothetical protein
MNRPIAVKQEMFGSGHHETHEIHETRYYEAEPFGINSNALRFLHFVCLVCFVVEVLALKLP